MNIRPKTKRRLIILTVIVVGLGSAIVGGVTIRRARIEAQIKAARAAGMAAYDAKDYPTALKELSVYLERSRTLDKGADGCDFPALFAYGKSREMLPMPHAQHLDEARNTFMRYLRLKPDDPPAAHELIGLHLALGYPADALAVAEQTLALHPDDPDALRGKAQALLQQSKPDVSAALKVAQHLNQVAPEDLRGQMQTLSLRIQQGVPAAQLIADAENLRKQHDGQPRYELLLGATYLQLNRADPAQTHADSYQREEWGKQARTWLQTAAGRNPPDAEYVHQVVGLMDGFGMFGNALDLLKRAADTSGSATASLTSDPRLRRMLVQRLWENDAYHDVARRTADLDPKSPAADLRLVILRAMSLYHIDAASREQAVQIAKGLADRKSDPYAASWGALLQARFAAPPKPAAEQVKLCQATLARETDVFGSAMLYFLMGDAYAMQGETENAAQAWDLSARRAPEWGMPHALVARVRLGQGRTQEALERAEMALQRSPSVQSIVGIYVTARWASLTADPAKPPRDDDLKNLLEQVTRVQEFWKDDPETLPLYVTLLSRTGQRDAATEKAKAATTRPSVPAETLLRLDAVARSEKLDVGDALVRRAADVGGADPAVALRRAADLLVAGKAAEGAEVLAQARAAAKGEADPRWAIANLNYLEMSGDPSAVKALVAMGDKYPSDLVVQTAALASVNRQMDRDFWARTIDRLHALTGDQGQLWRLERCRWLLSGDPVDPKGFAEGTALLTELVRQSPSNAEAHRLLGFALARDNKLTRATEELTLAASLKGDDPDVAVELVRVLRAAGKLPDARSRLDQLARRNDLSPESRLKIASLFEEDGRADRAIGVLTAASDGAATAPTTSNATSTAQLTNRMVEAARLGMLARLYRRVGRIGDADALYGQLLDQPGASASDLAAAAEFFGMQGKTNRADAVLKRLAGMRLRPGAMEVILARFQERFGSDEEAGRHFIGATSNDPKSAEAWRELAGYHLRHARYSDAAAAVARGLKEVPTSAALKALQQRVTTIAAMKRPQAAAPLLDLLTRDPSDAAAAQMLQIVADGQAAGGPDAVSATKIAQRLQDLADKYPDFLPAQEQLIQGYLDAGNSERAADVAARAAQNFPYEPEPARLLTLAHATGQRWAKMLEAASQWRQRTSGNPLPAEIAMAEAMLAQKLPQAAVQELAPYVQSNPLAAAPASTQPGAVPAPPAPMEQRLALYRTYARALIAAGRASDAADLLEPSLATSPEVRAIWFSLAAAQKDEAGAMAWIDRGASAAAKVGDNSIVDQFAVGQAWFDAGKAFHAQACFAKARDTLRPLTERPNIGPDVWALYAYDAQELGDYDEADRAWRGAIKTAGNNDAAPAMSNNLAYVLLMRGKSQDLAEARQLAERAVTSSPENSVFCDTLARVYSKLGNHALAVTTFKTALAKDAENIEAMIGLADELTHGSAQERVEARTWMSKISRSMEGAPPLSPELRKQLDTARAATTDADGGR